MFDEKVVKLTKEQFVEAESVAYLIEDEKKRKLSFLNSCALFALKNFVEKNKFNMDAVTNTNLFRVPSVAERYEISDLYINNIRFDVRVSLDGNVFPIPKVHIKNSILADYYVVFLGTKNPLKCEGLGFVKKDDLVYESKDDEYYYVSTSVLSPISYLKDEVYSCRKQPKEFYDTEHRISIENFGAFLDGELDSVRSMDLIEHLLECEECRGKFVEYSFLEDVLTAVKHYPELKEAVESSLPKETEEEKQPEDMTESLETNVSEENMSEPQEETVLFDDEVVEEDSFVDLSQDEVLIDEPSILVEPVEEISAEESDAQAEESSTDEISQTETETETNVEEETKDEYEIKEDNLPGNEGILDIAEKEEKQPESALLVEEPESPIENIQNTPETILDIDFGSLETSIPLVGDETENSDVSENVQPSFDMNVETGEKEQEQPQEQEQPLVNVEEETNKSENNYANESVEITNSQNYYVDINSDDTSVDIDLSKDEGLNREEEILLNDVKLEIDNMESNAEIKAELKEDKELQNILTSNRGFENTKEIYNDVNKMEETAKNVYEDIEEKAQNEDKVHMTISKLYNEEVANTASYENEAEIVEDVKDNSKKPKGAIIAVAASLAAIAVIVGGFLIAGKTPNLGTNKAVNTPNQNVEADANTNMDMDKSMAEAFSDGQNSLHVTKMSWLKSDKLIITPEIRDYMSDTANSVWDDIELNSGSVNGSAVLNSCKIVILINNEGRIKNVRIGESSGSQEVDNIVLNSVKTVVENNPPVNYSISGEDIGLVLVVNF